MRVAVEAATDLGLRRQHNEDAYAFWVPDNKRELDRRGVLLVLADGMGGSRAGEVASRLAADTVVSTYRAASGDKFTVNLREAIEAANREVHKASRSDTVLRGMGTTLTVVAVRGREAWLAHVGDSRAYLVHGDHIGQLTRDHSLVAQLVEHGHLTPAEARSDPRRNVITRSVGVGERVEVDIASQPQLLETGDTLLLCSDGLHGVVEDLEIADLISGKSLSNAALDLVELANHRGGPDNITVLLARLEP